eukprot:14047136-Ditylum_brightwellii.AAC.2
MNEGQMEYTVEGKSDLHSDMKANYLRKINVLDAGKNSIVSRRVDSTFSRFNLRAMLKDSQTRSFIASSTQILVIASTTRPSS